MEYERRGHPVLGAIGGALFFFFLGLTLMVFGVFPLEGPWLALPLIGVVLGAAWGWWAPIGRKNKPMPLAFAAISQTRPTSTPWTVRTTGEVPVVEPGEGTPPPGPVVLPPEPEATPQERPDPF